MAVIHDVEQGTAAWFALRIGRPTASEFHRIITPTKGELSKQWKPYCARLIWEKLTNQPTVSLAGIAHIEEGKRLEPFAVRQFEFINEVETVKIGFVTTDDGLLGASPDRYIVGQDKCFEAKCPTGPVHMFYCLFGHGDAYRPQIQGQLSICEKDMGVFYSFIENGPDYQIDTGRDEPYIRVMRSALDKFNDNLQEYTLKARALGVFQEYAETPTPMEVELGDEINREPPGIENILGAFPQLNEDF